MMLIIMSGEADIPVPVFNGVKELFSISKAMLPVVRRRSINQLT